MTFARTVPYSLFLVALGFCGGCQYRASAGTPAPVTRVIDPPSRVARISYLKGAVSFQAAGTDDWVAATLNRPLVAGDELWTDQGAQAELDLSHAFVRLDGSTSAGILNLDDRTVQIKISEGTAQVRLRRLDEEDQLELDTPQAATTLLRAGEYRVRVNPSGSETEMIARSGEVEITTPGKAFTVRAGQSARVMGIETVSYDIGQAPPADAFDDFCRTRDRRMERAESLRYVSPYVIGWEDLDEFGYWRDYPAYGSVWIPRVVGAGWAPYRFGHWVWIEPWGWTWIDDAPWGFAPFHYGRWVFVDSVWVWIPGPPRIRAVYAPALVVFVGGGPGLRYYFSIGIGAGVAWFPLGPREVYLPPYRTSRTYITNVNISHTVLRNTSNIWRTDVSRQHYANRGIAGAVTAVPEDVFAGGRPVGRSAVNVTGRQAAEARIGGSAPPVTPLRRSVSPPQESGPPAARPPEAVTRREVTVRRSPAPQSVPFEQKRPSLDRDPGRPPDAGKIDELRRQQPPSQPQYRRTPPPTPSPEPTATPRQKDNLPSKRQIENRRRSIEQERQRTSQASKQPARKQSPNKGR